MNQTDLDLTELNNITTMHRNQSKLAFYQALEFIKFVDNKRNFSQEHYNDIYDKFIR